MKEKIIVTLTTSPQRIDKIKPVLSSILTQTYKVNMIILNLPYIFKRNNTSFDTIPDFITENENIHINWVEDIGPATKIISTKLYNKIHFEDDDIFISIDDDTLYDNKFIENFMYNSMLYPDCVLTGNSFINFRPGINKKYPYMQLLEGFSGVLYYYKFIKDIDINIFLNTSKECYLGDDLFISNYLRGKGIDIVMIGSNNRQLDYGFKSDALHMTKGSNVGNYKKCINHLKENGELYLDIEHIDFLK